MTQSKPVLSVQSNQSLEEFSRNSRDEMSSRGFKSRKSLENLARSVLQSTFDISETSNLLGPPNQSNLLIRKSYAHVQNASDSDSS